MTTALPVVSDRFVEDLWLRRHGFEIFSRHGRCEAIWVRSGRLYTQKKAVEIVREEVVKKSKTPRPSKFGYGKAKKK